MALRFDPRVVLSMYQQSKMAAEENAQKDKLMAINQALEDRKFNEQVRESNMADADRDAQRAIEETRYKEQAAFQQQQLAETIRNNTLQHQAAMANSPARMQMAMAKLNADIQEKENARQFKLGVGALAAQQAFQKGAPTFDASLLGNGALNHSFFYESDAMQKNNVGAIERQLQGINQFLDYAEKEGANPAYAKAGINVNTLALPRYNDIAKVLRSYVGDDNTQGTNDWWDRIADNDTFLGMFGGASDEVKKRYEILNSIAAIKQRLNKNTLFGAPPPSRQ